MPKHKSMTLVYKERIRKIQSRMEPGSAMLLISAPARVRNHDVMHTFRNCSDFLYATGINEENYQLLLFKDKEPVLFVPAFDAHRARWMGSGSDPAKIARSLGIRSESNRKNSDKLYDELSKLLQGISRLYYNLGEEPAVDREIIARLRKGRAGARGKAFYPDTIIDPAVILHELRLFKEDTEISLIEKACSFTASGHRELMRFCRREISAGKEIHEYHCKAFIENEFHIKGAAELAYPSIVAAGKNGTVLHYEKSDARLQKNEMLLVDAACEFQGYAADVTRTFPATGKFSPLQKEVYSIVLAAQKKSIKESTRINTDLMRIHKAAVKELVNGLWELKVFRRFPWEDKKGKKKMIRAASRSEVLEKGYYRLFYMHSTSHWLGLDVHDAGRYYREGKPRKLKPGMFFTIEPGLYFPAEYTFLDKKLRGLAVRIEDDILMTNRGVRNLTESAPKEIAEIENLSDT